MSAPRTPVRRPQTLAVRVLELDAEAPGAADADFLVPCTDWEDLIALARTEEREGGPAANLRGQLAHATSKWREFEGTRQPEQCSNNNCGWCKYCQTRERNGMQEDFRRLTETITAQAKEIRELRESMKLFCGACGVVGHQEESQACPKAFPLPEFDAVPKPKRARKPKSPKCATCGDALVDGGVKDGDKSYCLDCDPGAEETAPQQVELAEAIERSTTRDGIAEPEVLS